MKLVPLTILIISLEINVKAQKFRQQQFPLPPQFQTPYSGLFSTDSSLYLPPETHTAIPYFPVKNVNNLQFPYLPPTGTKVPATYPTPFPFLISTSLVPNFEDDDEGDGIIRMSTSHPPRSQKLNHTERADTPKEKREMRPMINKALQQPIDRIDMKFPSLPIRPFIPPATTTSVPDNQPPVTRRMIISADTHRNDLSMDQIRAASFHGNQFVAAPVFVSSTTEPAIPILRLSNEMDLDGSFSYEALGADQTHYVQHSRMENMGNEKEEQVVEGSYSYVGDNGQTYTVHYIADSNGFRASGDHLPVAPPIPEIIQRSIQYNLAEEAKKPPQFKSWQDDGRDNQISDSDKSHHFVSPPRNLFTGRTPEAFSYSYSQGSNTQNNLVTSATSQVPVKTIDVATEQPKAKPTNGPISPQITFLASQGAHLPSMNSVQNSISRMFTTEKPPSSMPQLINYEAAVREADQDSNKALWRWQYGMNANNLGQIVNRDTISRSFGEGDDVMINFSDMSPEQYTSMIHSQVETNPVNVGIGQYPQNNQQIHETQNYNYHNEGDDSNKYHQDKDNDMKKETSEQYVNTQPTVLSSEKPIAPEDWYKIYNHNYNPQLQTTIKPEEPRKLISENKRNIVTLKHFDFPAPSQTVTQSYDFEETFYEPRKIKAFNTDINLKPNTNTANDIYINNLHKNVSFNDFWSTENEVKITTTEPSISTIGQPRFTDFIVHDSKNDFRPILSSSIEPPREIESTTTENSVEDIIQNNIFLKNLFKPEKLQAQTEKIEPTTEIIVNKESRTVLPEKIQAEPKADKVPKFIQYHAKPINEIKALKKKPIDISDILNYVSMKNHFESSKIKSKIKHIGSENFENGNLIRFIPVQQERERDEEMIRNNPEPNSNSVRSLNHEQQEELRGIIKNYKVLQRNNNNLNNKYDNTRELKRELSPPPLKLSPNFPPLGRAGPSMKSYLPPIYV